jgi:hypothetical protein
LRHPADAKTVRALCLSLPGTSEKPSYGTPGFRVLGKLFARLHQDGESLVVRADPAERELLIRGDPGVFFVTDHYLAHPWVQVRLAAVDAERLGAIVEGAWRLRAPARLLPDD